ncbi:hypothetical protein IMZ48_50110 [Candidatus Bathyarchaeota archaeon]|nr:hypothetical protein [Candidatus Bathyarchaeota archaeon]
MGTPSRFDDDRRSEKWVSPSPASESARTTRTTPIHPALVSGQGFSNIIPYSHEGISPLV